MFPQTSGPSPSSDIRSIAFVDSGISDAGSLLEGLSGHYVIQLQAGTNGIEEITQALSQHQNLDSIHVFSHGENGSLQLGNALLNQAFFAEYQNDFQRWGQALTEEGDLLLYGCNFAEEDEDVAFVQEISQATGADVAASNDLTGKGGDWELEVTTGSIEAAVALEQATQASYQGQLNLLTNGSFEANAVDNDQWNVFGATAVPGWQSLNGESIEIWDSGHNGVISSQGSNHMELDNANAALDAIYQDLQTQAGQSYQLTFDMRSRGPNFTSDDEAVVVEWNGVKTQVDGYRASASGEWTTITANVVGTGGSDRILFRESTTAGASDGTGPFLDNISLLADPVDPDPVDPDPVDPDPVDPDPVDPDPGQAGTLLVNGSFEANAVDNDGWAVFEASAMPGWQSSNGEGIEVWDSGHNGVASTEGSNHIELDNAIAPLDSIYQEIQTQAGQAYQLTFDMRSRGPNFNSADESVFVEWNGQTLQANGFQSSGADQWTTLTAEVIGTGGTDRLLFRESDAPGASDGTGPLLDNIALQLGNTSPTDTTPPTASLTAANITTEGGAYYTFTVAYTDNVGLNTATLDSSDIQIVRADGLTQQATLVTESNGTATYRMAAPGGTWDTTDNGTYSIQLQANQVSDVNGNVMLPTTLGSFDVAILDNPSPTDTTPPTASLTAANITARGGEDYTFTVAYTDNVGLNTATLDSNDIQIVRADGLTQQAALVTVNNGTAIYRITAPGGTWNTTDNGTYSIQLQANQVSDVNGNVIAPITLGSFDVAIAGSPTPTLINGSFEANPVDNDGWAPIAANNVPGWQSLNGQSIEFWDSGHSGVTSSDGSNHIELDYQGGGPLDGIYQDVQTAAGEVYNVSFDVRARRAALQSPSETVVVEWNGSVVNNAQFTANGDWTTVTVTVTGTGNSDRLTLRESDVAGASDGFGPLLDNIRLSAADDPDIDVGNPLPNGSGFTRETLVSGLDNPLAMTYADDGRIFVTEKAGRVKIIENGQVISTFIDINAEVNSYWDRGLMGIALDPDFANNGWVYLSYVVDLEPETPDRPDFDSAAGGRLIRVKVSDTNPNVADLSTREVILDGHQMTNATHAVGDVDFDNDGNLIFSWGDGGFFNNLRLEAQDPDSKQGKFFRVDAETGFGIPENPYYDPANPDSVRSKVWVTGVRNPWRWTVDRQTGDVYFGEVTDGGPEEANVIRANATTPEQLNFGWPYFEGDNRTRYGTVPDNFVSEGAYVELPHAGGYDAITGGAVYRGTAYSAAYNGRYFFSNFGQNALYTADADGNYQQFGNFGDYSSPVDIQLAPNGTIQYLSLFEGALYQLNDDSISSEVLVPNAISTASVTAGNGPLTVDFSSATSNSPNGEWLRHGWDFDSDGAIDSTEVNPSYTYNTVGKQTATLTITDEAGGTDTTQVEVTVTNSPPDNNLAFGKPTFQSSTAAGAIASRAVDGNTDNNFGNGSVTATAAEDKAFWEIDLGAIYNLNSVQIFVGNQPLSNYYVLASEEAFSGGNLSALLEDSTVWNYNNPGSVQTTDTITVNKIGRYLRIQLAELGVVSLAEVKVLGTPIV